MFISVCIWCVQRYCYFFGLFPGLALSRVPYHRSGDVRFLKLNDPSLYSLLNAIRVFHQRPMHGMFEYPILYRGRANRAPFLSIAPERGCLLSESIGVIVSQAERLS